MPPNRTIEPRSVKFAQRLLSRHRFSLTGSDLAETVVAKYAAFAGAGTEFSPLIDHSLTWRREIDGVSRHDSDREPERAPGEFTPSNGGARQSTLRRSGNMIQRRTLSDGPPAGRGFSPLEPAALPAPALRGALPAEALPGRSSQLAADRFSESRSRLGEFFPGGPVASGAGVTFFRAPVALAEAAHPAGTLPGSDAPWYAASAGRPVEKGRRSTQLFRIQRSGTAMGNDGYDDAPSGRPGSALSLVLAGMPVLKKSATQPGFLQTGRNSLAKGSAILSETSWRSSGAGSTNFAGFQPVRPGLLQAWAPEAFQPEFFWRDIRVNPLGRAAELAVEQKSAHPLLNPESMAAFSTPSFDLTLQLPKPAATSDIAVSAIESSPRRSFSEDNAVTARSTNTEMRASAEPQVLNVPQVADRVYRLLERRLVVERERRGVFRT